MIFFIWIQCLKLFWIFNLIYDNKYPTPRRRNRAKCSYRPLQRAKMFIPLASTGEMFIPPASKSKMFIPLETWLPAANYAFARNATFSTNLDTKRRVYLERHGGDVTRLTLRTRHNRHHATIKGKQFEPFLVIFMNVKLTVCWVHLFIQRSLYIWVPHWAKKGCYIWFIP